jgi:hypothetical protein
MRLSHRISSALAAAVFLTAAPAALAHTSNVGSTAGSQDNNVCLFMVDCTYVNYAHGRPADVVRHTGTIVSWRSYECGAVQLRVLRPAGHGRFKFVRSSAIEAAPASGINSFSAHIAVRAGDVLALRDAGASTQSSCLLFTNGTSAQSVSYYKPSPGDGSTHKPNASTLTDQMSGQGDASTPHLRVMFSATVKAAH